MLKSPPTSSGAAGSAASSSQRRSRPIPGELAGEERGADDPTVRCVQGDDPDRRRSAPASGSATSRRASAPRRTGRSRPPTSSRPGPLSRTGPSPKFVTTSSTTRPRRVAMATPFQRPSPWWSEVVAGHRERHRRGIVVGELRLLHEQDVRLGALEPPLDLLEAGLQRVDVPGRDAHRMHQASWRRRDPPRWVLRRSRPALRTDGRADGRGRRSPCRRSPSPPSSRPGPGRSRRGRRPR